MSTPHSRNGGGGGATTPPLSSSAKALTKRDADDETLTSSLGKYGPSHSTLRQTVLSEEAYTSTLSRLIQRDFFPHLERLEAENAYLDAITTLDEPGGDTRLEHAARRLVGYEVRAGLVPPSPLPMRPGHHSHHHLHQRMPAFDDTPLLRPGDGGGDADGVAGQWDPTPSGVARSTPREKEVIELQHREEEHAQAPSLEGLTLSAFQAAYTSEDNASFLQLLEIGQQRKKDAFRWAYEAEEKANETRRKALRAANLEAEAGFRKGLDNAPPDVRKRIEQSRQPKLLTTSNGEDASIPQTQLLNQVGGSTASPASPSEVSADASITSASGVPLWPHKARNALFYGPDADQSTLHSRTSSLKVIRKSKSSDNTANLYDNVEVQSNASHRAPGINFANTRLYDENSVADDDLTTGSETPRSSRIEAAIGGNLSAAPSTYDGMSQDEASLHERGATSYDFVSPLPSPRQGDLGDERVRQLMTWGTIMGTPRAVGPQRDEAESYNDAELRVDDGAYSSNGSFRMPATPRRDTLARRLADKASAGRKRTLQASRTAALSSSSSSLKRTRADLSPAARTLLDRTSRRTTLGHALLGADRREESTSDRLRRQRWTPSPSPRRRAD